MFLSTQHYYSHQSIPIYRAAFYLFNLSTFFFKHTISINYWLLFFSHQFSNTRCSYQCFLIPSRPRHLIFPLTPSTNFLLYRTSHRFDAFFSFIFNKSLFLWSKFRSFVNFIQPTLILAVIAASLPPLI